MSTPTRRARRAPSDALRAFLVKELRHILRDRQTLAILLLLPLAQVVVFGFALVMAMVLWGTDKILELLMYDVIPGGKQ